MACGNWLVLQLKRIENPVHRLHAGYLLQAPSRASFLRRPRSFLCCVMQKLAWPNLLSHVDGSVAAPTPTLVFDSSSQSNPKFVEWHLQDQRLLSLLFSSLTEEAMAKVLGLTNARDVWLALENSFSHISKTRELHIKDDLQLIKRGT
ncbi:uncharacterized protein LOC122307438 [Carya illinoinensis]|uniref:uncharacterized protein LOC122307438 n=1 Tax=Carya illinoinensis TaxID=32201 RepID=UPI001C719FA6|nr:uncharacterized protein LOC122307438 [Carya illinoinensis]